MYHCVQLSYTIQHRTVLIIFHPNLQTVITAQMLFTGEWVWTTRYFFAHIYYTVCIADDLF